MNEIEDLLRRLEQAVERGDVALAARLLSELEQRLLSASAELDGVEARMAEIRARMEAAEVRAEKAAADEAGGAGEVGDGLARVLETARRLNLTEDEQRDLREFLEGTRRPVFLPEAGVLERYDSGVERGGVREVGSGAGEEVEKRATQGDVYTVWFGTNREPVDAGDVGKGFTGRRSERTTLGRARVWVPAAHRFGEMGTDLWTRLKRGDLRDDHLRLQTIEGRDAAVFWAELQQEMAGARERGDTPDALVFLHGYNTSFEEAAIRAAQIGVDLKVPGATAFFSWASRGTVREYPADEACIEASEGAIAAFLVDFVRKCGAAKVHLVAHSMGNRGLLRALQRIAADAETRAAVRFGQIFLAAPDVDQALFLNLAHVYAACSERTTLYASRADLPVHVSAQLHGAPRAGYFLPMTIAVGIDTVAVPNFNVDLLGHSYFAEAAAILHDIFDLLRHGEAPGRRQRLRECKADGGATYWECRL